MTAQITDRFERRLGEEVATLRGEIVRTRSDLRGEIGELRTEMREGFASVRVELATVRGDMTRDRFELLKWAFAFWIGQFFATAALLTALARR